MTVVYVRLEIPGSPTRARAGPSTSIPQPLFPPLSKRRRTGNEQVDLSAAVDPVRSTHSKNTILIANNFHRSMSYLDGKPPQ